MMKETQRSTFGENIRLKRSTDYLMGFGGYGNKEDGVKEINTERSKKCPRASGFLSPQDPSNYQAGILKQDRQPDTLPREIAETQGQRKTLQEEKIKLATTKDPESSCHMTSPLSPQMLGDNIDHL